MKKKGFTLIELIVVIAIIGVLAAILVPAMLGYVKKSKITTANTTAKSIYNALNSSLTDMDSQDMMIKAFASGQSSTTYFDTGESWTSNTAWDKDSCKKGSLGDLTMCLKNKVNGYFTDIVKVHDFSFVFNKGGACVAAAAMNGSYPGAYPNAVTVDDFNNYNSGDVNITEAITYAVTGSFS